MLRADAERYANCLADSWRPLVTSLGVALPEHIEVFSCSLPPAHPHCADQSYAAIYAGDTKDMVLSAGIEYLDGEGVTLVVAHETAHWLQFDLRDEPLLALLSPMPADIDATDPGRTTRRLETQAQCLAVGMGNASDPQPLQHWLDLAGGPSDDLHWGEAIAGWVTQMVEGGRVGDCNAAVAAPSLVAHP